MAMETMGNLYFFQSIVDHLEKKEDYFAQKIIKKSFCCFFFSCKTMSPLMIYFFPIIFFITLFHWTSGAVKVIPNAPQAYQSRPLGASTNLPAANDDDEEETEDEGEVEEETKELNDIIYDDIPTTAKKLAIASRKSNGIRIESNSFFLVSFLFSIVLF